MASHDDELGSAGFILNRPTTVQLGDLVEGNALPQFSRSPLYLGGDVGETERTPARPLLSLLDCVVTQMCCLCRLSLAFVFRSFFFLDSD